MEIALLAVIVFLLFDDQDAGAGAGVGLGAPVDPAKVAAAGAHKASTEEKVESAIGAFGGAALCTAYGGGAIAPACAAVGKYAAPYYGKLIKTGVGTTYNAVKNVLQLKSPFAGGTPGGWNPNKRAPAAAAAPPIVNPVFRGQATAPAPVVKAASYGTFAGTPTSIMRRGPV